jgi:ribokinase
VSKVRVAVIGHVEWIQFARVPQVPVAGEIVHVTHYWEQPGGGGAVSAVQLRKLAGAVTFFTALGDDDLGHRARDQLMDLGVRVEAVFRDRPQRRGFTHLDSRGERAITVIGERMGPSGDDPLPWDELTGADAVYFTAGDRGALAAGRRARVLVASARMTSELATAGVALDVLVGSARDRGERYEPGSIQPPPRVLVRTGGRAGGTFETADARSGTYAPAPVPGPVADAYGCGDSFAGGLTFGLGSGLSLEAALALAARCGAACLTGHGPYEAQLRLD